MTPEQIRINARIAGITKNRPGDVETINALKAELKASRLADRIRETVESAPLLSDEQCSRLAALLLRGAA